MANNDIRVLGDVELAGALSFSKNFSDFPADPKPRTIIVKDGQAYMYTELVNGSGYFTWQPIGVKQTSYLHTQGVASTSWTVTHGFNGAEFVYFVYDNNHHLVLANIEVIDENTARINLTSAITGTAVFFSVQYVSAPAVNATESVTIGTITLRDANGVLTTNNNEVAMAQAVADAFATVYTKTETDSLLATAAAARDAADAVVTAKIGEEKARAQGVEGQLAGDIVAEAQTRAAADAAINARIDSALNNLDPAALDSLSEIVTAFQDADSSLNGAISALGASTTSAIGLEAQTRQAADQALAGQVADEAAARLAGDAAAETALANEAAARASGDAATLASAKTYADGVVATEATARAEAVTTAFNAAEAYIDSQISATLGVLASNVTTAGADANDYTDAVVASEAQARIAGDAATLQSAKDYADGKVLDEATARVQGDTTTLASAKLYADVKVQAEADARSLADTATLTSAKDYTDVELAVEAAQRNLGDVQTYNNAKTYTDGAVSAEAAARAMAVTNAIATAEAYADSAVASEAMARSTVDSALQSAITTEENRAKAAEAAEATARTAGDAATLASAKVYADAADATALASANAYTDGKIRPEVKSYMTAFDGDIIPSQTLTYNLGSPTHQFHSVYVGPGTLYVNGKPVIQDNSDTITFSTDPDQNLMIKTTGNGHLQLAAAAGTIDIQGTLAVQSGKRITDSAGIQVEFGNAIQMNSSKIMGLANPTVGTDAATKAYVDGLTTNDSTIIRTSGAQTIAGVKTFSDGIVVNGDLTVNGTTTTINAVTLKIADNLIDLNSDFTAGTPTENAGIRIMRGDLPATQVRWNETADQWEMTSDGATFLKIATTTDIANKSTALTGDVIGTGTSSISTYLSSTGVTAGTYGAAGSVGTFTVDAKGRITAAGNAAIQIASSQVSDFSSAARGAISAGTGISYNSTTGAISSTITQYTDAMARATVSAGTGISYNSTTGVISTSAIPNSSLSNSSVTVGTTAISLGGSSTTLAGLTSVSSTSFTGALTGNADTATKLATGRSIALSGDATGSATFDGSAGVTISATLAASGVTAGTYGTAAKIPAVTVDAKGRVTGVSETTVSVTSASITDFSEAAMDAVSGAFTAATHSGLTVSYDDAANKVALSLTNTGVSAGSYGNTTNVATVTVDAQGRVTSAGTAAIAFPVTSVAGKTGAVTLSTADVSEDTTRKYYTDARARAAISASGSIAYDSLTGVISYTTPSTSGITEGSNLYFTNTRARSAISVSGSLSYDSVTGVISYTTPVTSVFGRTGAVTLQSSDVTGALGFTPENAANKGVANGYASLDSAGKVPSAQLPSFVDDVVEYANTAGFPATGSAGIIYVALDTNKVYRWGSTQYVEISAAPGSTDAVTEGSTNLYFTTARARASVSSTTGAAGYNSSTGVITIPSTTAHITEGTNLYYTDARARASHSAGTGISYNSTTGVITNSDLGSAQNIFKNFTDGTNTAAADNNNDTFKFRGSNGVTVTVTNDDATHGDSALFSLSAVPNSALANSSVTSNSQAVALGGSVTLSTTNIGEGTNLYYTDARARAAVSVSTAAASGSGSLAYNSTTGVLTFTPPSLSSYLTAESDTLATVTGRGASTSTAVTFNGGLTTTSITVDSFGGIDTASLTTSATTASQVLDSNSATAFRTVKYLIQATSGTAYQSVELLLIHDGTTVSMVEYANVATGADLADFDADVSGGNVRLLVTPVNAATTFKVMKTLVGV